MAVDRSGWTREQLLAGLAAADLWAEAMRLLTNWQQRVIEAYAKDGRSFPADLTDEEREYVSHVRSAPDGGLRVREPNPGNFERPTLEERPTAGNPRGG